MKETENALQNLAEAVEKNEPKNYQLHHKIAQLIIRITTFDHPAAKFAKFLQFFISLIHLFTVRQ